MTRDISSANETASEASVIVPVWFVKLAFDDGEVNLSTYDGPLAWGGDSYVGAGAIGSISAADENSELARSTLEMTLRGLPADVVAIVLGEHYQGRAATLYLGYLNQSTRQLVDDPVVIYRGRMNTARVKKGEGTPPTMTVTLTVESRFADWDRPRIRRYNKADQQALYSGDTGLDYAEESTEKVVYWGQRAPS